MLYLCLCPLSTMHWLKQQWCLVPVTRVLWTDQQCIDWSNSGVWCLSDVFSEQINSALTEATVVFGVCHTCSLNGPTVHWLKQQWCLESVRRVLWTDQQCTDWSNSGVWCLSDVFSEQTNNALTEATVVFGACQTCSLNRPTMHWLKQQWCLMSVTRVLWTDPQCTDWSNSGVRCLSDVFSERTNNALTEATVVFGVCQTCSLNRPTMHWLKQQWCLVSVRRVLWTDQQCIDWSNSGVWSMSDVFSEQTNNALTEATVVFGACQTCSLNGPTMHWLKQQWCLEPVRRVLWTDQQCTDWSNSGVWSLSDVFSERTNNALTEATVVFGVCQTCSLNRPTMHWLKQQWCLVPVRRVLWTDQQCIDWSNSGVWSLSDVFSERTNNALTGATVVFGVCQTCSLNGPTMHWLKQQWCLVPVRRVLWTDQQCIDWSNSCVWSMSDVFSEQTNNALTEATVVFGVCQTCSLNGPTMHWLKQQWCLESVRRVPWTDQQCIDWSNCGVWCLSDVFSERTNNALTEATVVFGVCKTCSLNRPTMHWLKQQWCLESVRRVLWMDQQFTDWSNSGVWSLSHVFSERTNNALTEATVVFGAFPGLSLVPLLCTVYKAHIFCLKLWGVASVMTDLE